MVTRRFLPAVLVIVLILTFSSCTCIYFNTFHNIRKNFNGAEKTRRKDGRDMARGGETKQYGDAITKAARVIERHPNSGWVDDALFIMGASYYYLGEFDKSARKFKELYANYPQSQYLPEARVLLAKAKLQLKEEAEAVVLFEEIFDQGQNRDVKAEAARSLAEYYFEAQDYDRANRYFGSLIDSLGQESDRIRAYKFIGDGFYERYKFPEARSNYEKTLKHNPDSLQYYEIMFRMAECDYFLFNIGAGLEKLQSLADNQIYFDSLGSIRLKMAEGYEWEGDLEAAINTYNKVAIENPKKEAAARALYELGLIYQYDLEDLTQAQFYYTRARDELRQSTVFEDATRRVSQLSLLEQYTAVEREDLESDSAGRVDPQRIDQLSENQYLLGELYYYDLNMPDSAINSLEILLQRFPRSSYAPRALMSLAYIWRNEYADTARADSALRRVLSDYADYDEAEVVIDLLGLAGTRADSGYAAIPFNKAERFLEEFQNLDRRWYFPFEKRYERPVDTTGQTGESKPTQPQAGEKTPPAIAPPPQTDSINLPASATDTVFQAMDTTSGPPGPVPQSDSINPPPSSTDTVFQVIDTTGDQPVVQPRPDSASLLAMPPSETVRLMDLMKQSRGGADSGAVKNERDTLNLSGSDSLSPGEPQTSDSTAAVQPPAAGGPGTDYSLDPAMAEKLRRWREQQQARDEKPSGIISPDTTGRLPDSSSVVADTVGEPSIGEPLAEESDTATAFFDQPVDTVERTAEYYAALALLDSARYYYKYVADSFPHSQYSTQARYLLLWTYDKYFAPGDSSLIDLYAAFVDSFPASDFAAHITKEYNIRPARMAPQQSDRKRQTRDEEGQDTADSAAAQGQTPSGPTDQTGARTDDSAGAISKFITDANGKQLPQANEYFLTENVRFDYPIEAIARRIEDVLYFHIRIGFDGRVDELVLMNPTASAELNERITETVKNTMFDSGRIPPELYDSWFYYSKEVRVPAEYRQ